MRTAIALLCFVAFAFAGCQSPPVNQLKPSDDATLRKKITGKWIDPNGPSRGTVSGLTLFADGKYEMVIAGPPKYTVSSSWQIEHGNLLMFPIGDNPPIMLTNFYSVFRIEKIDSHNLILAGKNNNLWKLTR